MIKFCVLSLLAGGLWSCSEGATVNPLNNESTVAASALTKAQDPTANGDASFCNDPTATCDAGEGDCDSDAQCTGALICGRDNGPKFGMPERYDVCIPAHCQDGVNSGNESGVDCGGSCGTCTQIGTNGDTNYCQLNTCQSGEGDCDSDTECAAGLICTKDVGDDFGFASNIDVCLAAHCSNNVKDDAQGETGVDCGGPCAPCPNMNPLPLGDPDYCNDPNLPCGEGEADCDIDAHCLPGLVCKQNVGAQYGFPAFIDVCVAAACGDGQIDGPTGDIGIDCGGAECADCGFDLWNRSLNNAGNARVFNVSTNSVGSVIVAGEFSGTLNLGGSTLTSAGGTDIFVAKYNDDGSHVWSVRFGGASDDLANNVSVDSADNILVAGSHKSTSMTIGATTLTNSSSSKKNSFVAKLAGLNGAGVWARSFNSTSNSESEGVIVDSAGDAYVVGSFVGTVDFGSGAVSSASSARDGFIVKLAGATGVTTWSRREGGVSDDFIKDVVIAGNGNILYGVTTRSGAYTITAMNVVNDPKGDFDILFVEAQPADGAVVWSKRTGGSGAESLENIAVDTSGNIYATGYFSNLTNLGGSNLTSSGPADIFVVKYDSTGNHIKSLRMGSDGFDAAESISVSNSTVYITGYFQNTVNFGGPDTVSAGGTDVFVVKQDLSLNHQETQRYGSDGLDFGRAIVSGAGVFVSGYYSGNVIDLGSGPITGGANDNGFLIRLNP